MTASILLNAFGVVAMRLVLPWQGVWFADCDLDPGLELGTLPPGPALLTLGEASLIGTIDPAAQGVFGARAGARVVGGRGGWGQSVPPQHFHNDAVLVDAQVIAATAAAVGEAAVVAVPEPLGIDYVRAAGPASAVLEGYDWHVDLLGVTQVAPRVPVPLDPTSFDVISFDPIAQRVTLATDAIVQPGSILVDELFGTLTVRDVEQSFAAGGARAECWCGSNGVSRLDAALSTFVRQKAGLAQLRTYRYRIVQQNVDGRLQLQPVKALGPMPATLPLSVVGPAGISATYTPGTICHVAFLEGDPSQPRVVAFEAPGQPLTLTLDAATVVKVGAAAVKPVALYPELAVWAAAVVTACGAASPSIVIPPLPASVASTKLQAV